MKSYSKKINLVISSNYKVWRDSKNRQKHHLTTTDLLILKNILKISLNNITKHMEFGISLYAFDNKKLFPNPPQESNSMEASFKN